MFSFAPLRFPQRFSQTTFLISFFTGRCFQSRILPSLSRSRSFARTICAQPVLASPRSNARPDPHTRLMAYVRPAQSLPTAEEVKKAQQEPQGVDREARVLEQFVEVPSISRGFLTPSATGGVDIMVVQAQRNLPANKQRRFLSTVHIPVSAIMGSAPTMIPSLPMQLPEDAVIVSPSPSGRRMCIVRQVRPQGGENCEEQV